MKRRFVCLVVVMSSWAAFADNSKADWMFAPPIYKRPRPTPIVLRPQADDGPYYTQPQGEYTNTSMRYMNSIINIQGETCDDYQVTQTYTQRRRAEGKTDREIRRCIKRYLARHLYRTLTNGSLSNT